MNKVILWLLIMFFSILILSSLLGGSYEGFQEGAAAAALGKPMGGKSATQPQVQSTPPQGQPNNH